MPICPPDKVQPPLQDQHSLGRRSIRGTIWTVIGNGLSQVLLLLAHIVCARILGREGYGKFGAVTSTTATVGLLAGLGLSLTATKYIAELRRPSPVRAKRILVLAERMTLGSGVIMAVVMGAFSGYLAKAVFAAPSLMRPLQVSAVTILFMCVSTLQTAVLAAFERFKESAKLAALRAVICLPGMIAGSYYGGVTGTALGLLAGTAATCLVGRGMVSRCLDAEGMSFQVSDIWREKAIFWSFSFPSLLGGILASGAAWGLNVILVRTSATFEGMAVLNASRQWLSALTFLPLAIGAGSIPVLSSVAHTLIDKDAVRAALRVPNLLVRVSIWPVTLVLFFLSPEILKAYGSSYLDGLPTFLWMIGGMAVAYTAYGAGLVVQSRGLMWFGLTHQVVYAAVSLVVGYLLCRRAGPLGVAQGVAAGAIAVLLWMLAILVIRYSFPLDLALNILRDSSLMLGLVFLLSRYLLEIPTGIRLSITLFTIVAFAWQGWRIRELREAISDRFPVLRRPA
jgi:O-antigen/teichoic acid export membrane protein